MKDDVSRFINFEIDEETKKIMEKVVEKALKEYNIAKEAKKGGLDPSEEVEASLAVGVAERTEVLIGPKGIGKYFKEKYEELKDREKTIFAIFEDIVLGKFGGIKDEEKRVEQAIKTALTLFTEGVVVSPLEGLPRIKFSKNEDGSTYIDLYYASPIRAAGGTAAVLPLVLADYARKLLNLERYKPTKKEIDRYVEEIRIYNTIYSRQTKLKDEDVEWIIKNCPVCINGEPTEDVEVVVNRDVDKIETNRVRGGMCLVIIEGIGLKAAKLMKYAKKLGLDWSWLKKLVKVKVDEGEKTLKPNFSYLQGMAAGRPIFSHPLAFGGFRLRYGRARNTGIAAKAIHPATMYILEEFPAVGTQFKVEFPGKAAAIMPCDTIEGPVVKLKSGDVVKIETVEDAVKLKEEIEEILFLGDILVSYGDFRKAGSILVPPGFVEEWWALELEEKDKEGIYKKFVENPKDISFEEALEISKKLGVPLHPKFLFYYKAWNKEDVLYLSEWFSERKYDKKAKKLLENAGIPHKIKDGGVVFDEEVEKSLALILSRKLPPKEEENIFEYLSRIAGVEIKDKGGTFVGTRMGRPEAAKPRKMKGNPHGLFPVGLAGGPTRSVNKAHSTGKKAKCPKCGEIFYFYGEKPVCPKCGVLGRVVKEHVISVETEFFVCQKCGKEIPTRICPYCGGKGEKRYFCQKCGYVGSQKICPRCKTKTKPYKEIEIDLDLYLKNVREKLNIPLPDPVKGVKGLSSEEKTIEPLEKVVLRALHGVYVFRDGTVRMDLLDVPLTHFKPKELNLSVEKLRELGYEKDAEGKEIKDENQLIPLFPQDVIINEEVADYLLRVTKFIDDLLEKYYGKERYYNFEKREDLIGTLIIGIAPHTSAGIVGRIIGFTKAKVLFAHPYFHMAKRRNTDGDQDGIALLLDVFLNFSYKYLPKQRGGKMDAPLTINLALNPLEIDDEVYEMETISRYPLELYKKAEEFSDPEEVNIKIVKNIVGTNKQFNSISFTHSVSVFDMGPKKTRYVSLKEMEEKIKTQVEIQKKIRAVNTEDAIERLILNHLLPDIIGNTRSFSRQKFRCVKCNEKYRRIPLKGVCPKCGGNIILTISEGSVKKYLDLALYLVNNYEVSPYLRQRLLLIQQEVNALFQKKEKQKSLFSFS